MAKNNSLIQGINIQFPVVDWILDGKKVIETRKYPIPEKFIGKPLAIIETPGKNGKFKARIAGVVIFDKSFKYKTRAEFYKDASKHQVTEDLSEFSWESAKGIKYGWPILGLIEYRAELPKGFKKGIVFANNVPIPSIILAKLI